MVFFERRKCSTSKVCSLMRQESLENLILTVQCHVMVRPECERLLSGITKQTISVLSIPKLLPLRVLVPSGQSAPPNLAGSWSSSLRSCLRLRRRERGAGRAAGVGAARLAGRPRRGFERLGDVGTRGPFQSRCVAAFLWLRCNSDAQSSVWVIHFLISIPSFGAALSMRAAGVAGSGGFAEGPEEWACHAG